MSDLRTHISNIENVIRYTHLNIWMKKLAQKDLKFQSSYPQGHPKKRWFGIIRWDLDKP